MGEKKDMNRIANRPEDEREIISDATTTLKETKRQISRVQNILEAEIRRLDQLLEL